MKTLENRISQLEKKHPEGKTIVIHPINENSFVLDKRVYNHTGSLSSYLSKRFPNFRVIIDDI